MWKVRVDYGARCFEMMKMGIQRQFVLDYDRDVDESAEGHANGADIEPHFTAVLLYGWTSDFM